MLAAGDCNSDSWWVVIIQYLCKNSPCAHRLISRANLPSLLIDQHNSEARHSAAFPGNPWYSWWFPWRYPCPPSPCPGWLGGQCPSVTANLVVVVDVLLSLLLQVSGRKEKNLRRGFAEKSRQFGVSGSCKETCRRCPLSFAGQPHAQERVPGVSRPQSDPAPPKDPLPPKDPAPPKDSVPSKDSAPPKDSTPPKDPVPPKDSGPPERAASVGMYQAAIPLKAPSIMPSPLLYLHQVSSPLPSPSSPPPQPEVVEVGLQTSLVTTPASTQQVCM